MSLYREAPRHARPSGILPHIPHRAGQGRRTASLPAGLRLARWTPLIWWVLARTIEVVLPGRFAHACTLAGAAGTMLLIVVVETWLGTWQRIRMAVPAS